jgi:hypothetical protein
MSKNIKNILQGQMTEASGTKSPGGQEATPIKREASNPPTAKSSNSSNAPPQTGLKPSNLSNTKGVY